MLSISVFGLVTTKKNYRDIIKFKNFLLLILFSIAYTIIYTYAVGTTKSILVCFLYAVYIYIAFKSSISKSIFSGIIYMMLLLIPDLFILLLLTRVFGMSKSIYYSAFAGSILGNIVISLIMILLVYILRKPLRKVVNYKLSSNAKIITISLATLITIAIFFYNLINNYRQNDGILTYLLVIVTLIAILFYLFKEKIDNENIFKKYDDLLTVMRSYESDIEEQRTINHETKNELLTIRGKLSDKKDKDICEYIDSIMGDKKSAKTAKFSKFKYLPSNGLKGFLYYKFIEAEQKGVSVILNVSKSVEDSYLGKMKTKDFKDLTRIIGVYIDNAIEASSTSSDKKLGLEIYIIKDIIKIIISNSYDTSIDKEKIGNERYSTKGKNRGHGLLLVKRILNENNRITAETKVTERLYIQIIKIKQVS